ncbi:hypothetical protein T484DRAFT_1766252 [Baffinella frigidus]|nr:hypothetical protein T484DRAFT_1766252 [Cryptophyta sp. CCMP2293]
MGAEQSVCDVCGVSKHLRELDAAPKEVVRRGGVPDFVETLQQQDRQKMLAKFVNNVPVLSRLLSDRIYHEFDINYTDPITGDSALHKAAKLGNLLSCQCLIQHGAVMQRNKAGLSPANIAEASGHRDVQVYLENRVFARNELPPPVPPITPLGLGYAPAPVKAGGARVWKQEDGVWEWCDAYLVLKSSRLGL